MSMFRGFGCRRQNLFPEHFFFYISQGLALNLPQERAYFMSSVVSKASLYHTLKFSINFVPVFLLSDRFKNYTRFCSYKLYENFKEI